MSDLVKKEAGALAVFGAGTGINPKEIIIPIVQIRQAMFRRDQVKSFVPGDMFKNPGYEPIAKLGEAVEIVPLAIKKQYRILDVTKASEPKGVGYEDWVPDMPWQWEDGGVKYRRDQTYSVFAMFREDLTRQAEMMERLAKGEIIDPDDFALPFRLALSRAAFPEGKKLASYFEIVKAANQTPAAIVWNLKTVEKKNDMGTWYIFELSKAVKDRKFVPRDLIPAADGWVKVLQSNDVKLAEADDDIETIDVPNQSEERF